MLPTHFALKNVYTNAEQLVNHLNLTHVTTVPLIEFYPLVIANLDHTKMAKIVFYVPLSVLLVLPLRRSAPPVNMRPEI